MSMGGNETGMKNDHSSQVKGFRAYTISRGFMGVNSENITVKRNYLKKEVRSNSPRTPHDDGRGLGNVQLTN